MSTLVPSAGRARLAAAEQVTGGWVGVEAGVVVAAAGAAGCGPDAQLADARVTAMAATAVAADFQLRTKLAPHASCSTFRRLPATGRLADPVLDATGRPLVHNGLDSDPQDALSRGPRALN